MASNPPFQLEDNLDEDFFDNLVSDDDDFKVNSSSAPILADENDTDEVKAFAKLSIGEVKAETIENDVKAVSMDASAENSNPLASVDSFSFDSVVESDNGMIQHEVPTATETVESVPDSTVSYPKTTSNEVALGAEVAVGAEVASGLSAKEGSGSASSGSKEVQWSAFSNDAVHSNGFGSYSDLFGDFEDNAVEQLQNDRSNLNSESNVQFENNHNIYGASVEQSTIGQEQSTNWEDLYPGWKYDSNTGQWYQVDGQDPAVDWAAEDKSEVSYLQQTTQSVSETVTESGKTESVTNWNQTAQANDTLESVSNWNQTPQENNGYPSNMVFDPQYPGWYYDTITQEWLSLDTYNSSLQSTVQSQDHLHQNGFSPTVTSLENEQRYTQVDEAYNWGDSSNNFNQQGMNMWQPDSSAPGVANSESGQSQQIENHQSQNFSAGNQFSQQKPYNSEKENQGYNGFSANSGSLGFVPQFNQPIIEQNQGYNYTQQQQIQSGNSSNYLQQQQIQSVNQFSYAPTAGRSSAGRPPHALVNFGFGGKLIVMKDNASLKNTSYGTQDPVDSSISVLSLTEVLNVRSDASRFGAGPCDYFRTLCQLSFPGPLTGGSVGVKELNKWIDERISNSESLDMDYRQSEVLSLLMSLLKIACQHYGKLRSPFGTDTTLKESDVPEAAVAKLFASVKRKNGAQFSEYGGSVANCLQKLPPEGQMLATAVEVQTLLVSGKKKEALHCAQQGQLWGPALVLAAQLGDQYYVDTVKQMALRQLVAGTPLRTLCLLIAGQPADVFSTETAADTTPIYTSPNISQQPAQLGANGMLDDWEENLAVITANRTKDDELVLIHLGDCLWKERSEIIAAHICYLVAEANIEPYSDSARLCLVGADHWKFPRTYASPQAIQRTEIYEYSKVMGNSQYMLLPFQPYKLIYAYMLAEVGRVSDSLKYCQAVSRTLKTGRAPEVETWRQLVSSLEERIKTHQQGGFSTNLAPAKLVGKLLNLFDSTAHRVVGGLPPPVPSVASNSQVNEQYNQTMGPRVSTSQSTMAMSSLIPSASTEPITEWTSDRMTMQNRSASEPNFVRTPTQDHQFDSSKETTTSSFPPSSKNNNNTEKGKASASTSRFGRFSFGTQLLQKTVGLVMKPRQDKQAKLGETNKFYYDEKLKRWVEEGVDPPAEEAALPPPPTAVAFPNGTMTSSLSSDYNLNNSLKSEVGGGGGMGSFGSNGSINSPPTEYNNNNYYNNKIQNSPPSSGYGSSGIPPIPPTSNQFSARGRMGVRSRYVDTFNKGGGNPSNLFQPPAAPSVKPTTTTASPKFFIPTPSSPSPSSVEHTMDPTVTQNAQITETPSIPTMNNSYQSPSPPPPMTMQRFASMDNMTRTNTNTSGGSLSAHSRRTASWSGTAGDAFTSPPPNSGSSALPHSSMNGGSYSDDLDEVEL